MAQIVKDPICGYRNTNCCTITITIAMAEEEKFDTHVKEWDKCACGKDGKVLTRGKVQCFECANK